MIRPCRTRPSKRDEAKRKAPCKNIARGLKFDRTTTSQRQDPRVGDVGVATPVLGRLCLERDRLVEALGLVDTQGRDKLLAGVVLEIGKRDSGEVLRVALVSLYNIPNGKRYARDGLAEYNLAGYGRDRRALVYIDIMEKRRRSFAELPVLSPFGSLKK